LQSFLFFFVFNFTGLFFSPALAPTVNAAIPQVETIPEDIRYRAICDLDWIIFAPGKRKALIRASFHAVIKQESKYNPKAVSHVGGRGPHANDACDREAFRPEGSIRRQRERRSRHEIFGVVVEEV